MSESSSRASSLSRTPLPAFLQQTKAEIHDAFVDLEWRQRNRLAAGLQSSSPPSQFARLSQDEMARRNRYMNVEPFASNRVKLRVADGANDYINASPIVLGNRRYIATQGPKDTSTSQFYRMLASETSSVAVVVMLTQTHEAGHEKCFQYYPLDDESSPLDIKPDLEVGDAFHGEVVLMSSEVNTKSRTLVRRMKLRTKTSAEGEEDDWTEKEIYHLLFEGWPDFSVPEGEDRAALLEMIALSARLNKDAPTPESSSFSGKGPAPDAVEVAAISKNPRIVHCSAGVGRSGTFIALDYMLSLLDAGELDKVPAGTDPIAETVDRLREQRMMMVQGEGQFMFCYEVLREAWIKRYKSLQT